jgi:[ribosomal protein S5]-alanine N-acetyltransferase
VTVEFETARLQLRRPAAADAAAIFERYASDPEVTRYLAWPRHRSLDETRAFVQFSDSEWARSPVGPLLAFSRADGALLGATGLSFETPDRASTGYVLARSEWGKGYATEALQAMVELSRSNGVKRLYAICHVDHRPSSHVMEKCGFEREGIMKQYAVFPNLSADLADVFIYARHD